MRDIRVLHSALMVSASAGIVNQMTWEQDAADALGLNWNSVLFCRESHEKSRIIREGYSHSRLGVDLGMAWLGLRSVYYDWLSGEQDNWDLILLRHSLADPLQTRYMRRYGHKTILVHHTKEVEEVLSGLTVKSKIKAAIERRCGEASLRLARGVIGVTPEILSYEVARVAWAGGVALSYPNGISFDNDSLAEDLRSSEPEILFVAGYFSPWHGLDRLLKSLRRSDRNFILHLVGDVCAQDRSMASGDSRVRLHGPLNGPQIKKLSSCCWLGLSSFALDRKGMQQACTLKVREYLRNGLPVYADHQEIFPADFSFYRQGQPEIDSILSYAYEMRSIGRMAVREAARPLISKQVLLSKLYTDLCFTYS